MFEKHVEHNHLKQSGKLLNRQKIFNTLFKRISTEDVSAKPSDRLLRIESKIQTLKS